MLGVSGISLFSLSEEVGGSVGSRDARGLRVSDGATGGSISINGPNFLRFIDLTIPIPSVENPWAVFFIITTVMVIPSLICLWFIRNKIQIVFK
mgnify:CR=1 FL=1